MPDPETPRISRDWTETLPNLGPRPTDDSGHDTYRRYEFQPQVLFTWCMHLLANRNSQTSLRLLGVAPESYEDFAAVWYDPETKAEFFELVQVKSTDPAASSPSDIVSKHGLGHLYTRWRDLASADEDIRMSLACRADLSALANEIEDITKISLEGATPLAIVLRQIGAKIDDEFWEQLTLYKPFPSPGQIDRYNIGILVQLRLKEMASLDGVEAQYRNLMGRLRDGFLGRLADEKILQEQGGKRQSWAEAVKSRAIRADEILAILSDNTVPARWAGWIDHLSAMRNRALVWLNEVASSKLQAGEAGSGAAAGGAFTPSENEQLSAYRIYLPDEVRGALDGIIASMPVGETFSAPLNTAKWSALVEIISRCLSKSNDDIVDMQPGQRVVAYDYGSLDIPAADKRAIAKYVDILKEPLSSRDLSDDARRLFIQLLKHGDVNSDGCPSRKVPPQKIRDIYSPLSKAGFGRLVAELEEARLASWDVEADDYGNLPSYEFRARNLSRSRIVTRGERRVRIEESFHWDEFMELIPNWESLILQGVAVPLAPTAVE